MFQNTEDMAFAAQRVYTSPTSSIENTYSMASSSQDSWSSTTSEKVPSPDSTDTPGKPYLNIIEEPANQFRFRYVSEMQGTHGAILGVNATKNRKTHPTVKLFNYEGVAIIRCTLYTAENKRRRLHVHRLVGKLSGRAEKDDPHDLQVDLRENYTASFQNLVIIHTAKKMMVDELLGKKKRIAEAKFTKKLEIDKSVLGKMRLECEQELKGMNMNSVSLKFEAFTLVGQQYIQICEPVYSQPINNMKSHVTGQLRICRLSKFYSFCEGGEEILLFVEKVGKDNIKVLFTELDDDGNEIWRDYATHVDVHHQFGISCRCPKYKTQDVSREVLVKMQLERPSDGARSETRDFVYKPRAYSNTAKRRRLDSTAFSPQIPDSTLESQIDTSAAEASCSSIVLQTNNTDPLLDIGKPYLVENDYVMLQETLLSSHIEYESLNENTIEENASSSISFSAEMNKYPTPPETLIQEVYSSEELQRAIREEAITPEHGELVPDSFFTRNIKRNIIRHEGNNSEEIFMSPYYLGPVSQESGSIENELLHMARGFGVDLSKYYKQFMKQNVDKALDVVKSTSQFVTQKALDAIEQSEMPVMQGPGPTYCQSPAMGVTLRPDWRFIAEPQAGKPFRAVPTKDFAKHTLQRLQQIIDTAVFPHITKADIENELLMELRTCTKNGDSVLHSAIRHQQFKLVKRMLDCIKSHFGDLYHVVNCPNKFSQLTPLHVAAQSSNAQIEDIIEYLLELGADPNKTDNFEFTPLHLAVKENNLSAAKCLLNFPGVNINHVSANMGTALHIAAEENRCEMAKLLIQHGADVNSIDLQRGQTSLHVAVKKSNVQIVDLLLKQVNIDINKKDYRCQTPLKFAILRADTRLMKIVNKLINHGASYESLSIQEETDDDSLESVQDDDEVSTRSRKMQTLAFLFSQISVAEKYDNGDDASL